VAAAVGVGLVSLGSAALVRVGVDRQSVFTAVTCITCVYCVAMLSGSVTHFGDCFGDSVTHVGDGLAHFGDRFGDSVTHVGDGIARVGTSLDGVGAGVRDFGSRCVACARVSNCAHVRQTLD
jgi:hypothetical protein